MKRFVNIGLYFIIFGVILNVIVSPVEAVKVITSFDKRTVDIDDEIRMTIKIVGNVGNLQRPRLPEFDAFNTYYTGRASHFSFVNGKSEHTLEFRYVLVPTKPGDFTIGPFAIPIGNTMYRTEPITIKVLSLSGKSARTKPQGKAYVPPATRTPFTTSLPPSAQQPPPQTVPKGADQDLFIQVTADKKKVYTNEQILLTYTIYTNMNVRYEGFEEEPGMSGFWIEDLPEKKYLSRDEAYINGKRYVQAEIRKVALFPTRAGTYTIQPGIIKCSVKKQTKRKDVFDSFFDDSFFGGTFFTRREPRLLETKPITITVIPFPEKGKPPGFTGLSGDFTMKVGIDKKKVKQNEPVTMKIEIEGKGNIETIEKPSFEESDEFKIYDGDISTQIFKETGVIQGKKTFEIIFVPTKSGEQTIPPVTFDYFNLKHKKYLSLMNGPFSIIVLPGKADASFAGRGTRQVPDELKEEIVLEAHDIRYIKQNIIDRPAQLKKTKVALFSIDLIMLLLFILFFIMKRQKDVLDRDVVLKRKKIAFAHLKKKIKALKRLAHTQNIQFFEESARALDQYIADKFNFSAQGLTWEQIEGKLRSIDLDDETIKKCSDFYETCNFARFASSTISPANYKELESLLLWLGEILERKIK